MFHVKLLYSRRLSGTLVAFENKSSLRSLLAQLSAYMHILPVHIAPENETT